jgi:hypothetical protein
MRRVEESERIPVTIPFACLNEGLSVSTIRAGLGFSPHRVARRGSIDYGLGLAFMCETRGPSSASDLVAKNQLTTETDVVRMTDRRSVGSPV